MVVHGVTFFPLVEWLSLFNINIKFPLVIILGRIISCVGQSQWGLGRLHLHWVIGAGFEMSRRSTALQRALTTVCAHHSVRLSDDAAAPNQKHILCVVMQVPSRTLLVTLKCCGGRRLTYETFASSLCADLFFCQSKDPGTQTIWRPELFSH